MSLSQSPPAQFGIASAPGDLPMSMIKERTALKAATFRHDNTISPTMPTPAQTVTITATSGAVLAIERVEVWYTTDGSHPGVGAHVQPMTLASVDWCPDTAFVNEWQTELPPQTDGTTVRYQIVGYSVGAGREPDHVAHDGSGFWYRYGADGLTTFAYRVREQGRHLPDWMKDAVIYQIFIDRFRNDLPDGSWENSDDPQAKHGGSLQGVIHALPYLQALGVNCLWLSPIGPAPSYHRYDQTSFFDVDSDLGGLQMMRRLKAEAQERGLRLILDFVPSHGSWKMPEFVAAQSDRHAETASWFIFDEWPHKYRSFLGAVPSLVSFNSNDPGLRRFLLDSARFWLCEIGFDGLRLDHSIGHGLDFWVKFCSELEAIKPDVALFGEATDTVDNLRLQSGRLQGVLDFPLASALRLAFGTGEWGAAELAGFLRSYSLYMADGPGRVTFFDNHDMDRLLYLADQDKRRLRLATLCLLTLPQPPTIYYGTEVGLSQIESKDDSGFGGDHVIRADMPWAETKWDQALLRFFKTAIAVRHKHALLRHGEWALTLVDSERQLLGYHLSDGNENLRVYLNLGRSPQTVAGETGQLLLSTHDDAPGAVLPPLGGKLFA